MNLCVVDRVVVAVVGVVGGGGVFSSVKKKRESVAHFSSYSFILVKMFN